VVENLSTAHFERVYAGRGSAAYHPNMLLALLVYGYAARVFSSRKIEHPLMPIQVIFFVRSSTAAKKPSVLW